MGEFVVLPTNFNTAKNLDMSLGMQLEHNLTINF